MISYRAFDIFIGIFNANTVEAITVIIVIFLLCNDRISKYQYRPSLICMYVLMYLLT